ncbi:MAG: PASTA domain-containing protein, partial [Clostridia bacterium]|nr:PASTA domain-containing protein [Clostridia bacterium]
GFVGGNVTAAKEELERRGIAYEVIGGGETITGQTPEAGSAIVKENGIVYIYTEGESSNADITVPDLIGKSAEAANRMLVNLGLNVSITGASGGSAGATVTTQSIAAGTLVTKGTVVEVGVMHEITSDD